MEPAPSSPSDSEELGAVGGAGTKVDSQLQEAARLKSEGNALYREKRIRAAIGRYHRALLVLRGLDARVTSSIQGFGPQAPALSSKQEEQLRSTQVDCYNNLAACLLQRECVDYARVRDYSLRVLQWRAGDVKALYRAGVATLELGDAHTARQYLTQAIREQPNGNLYSAPLSCCCVFTRCVSIDRWLQAPYFSSMCRCKCEAVLAAGRRETEQ
uniref:Tetratricopeptide repeat protein 9C n=1 Tax=Scleropages formosus TaxID=113540 RepID=A0A8C9SW62_SCLFO